MGKKREREAAASAVQQHSLAMVAREQTAAASNSGASASGMKGNGSSQEEMDMMAVMGFGNFDTTKNKKIKGNDVGDVNILAKRKYRQYMNRKGGFNRPLDYTH